MRQKRAKSYRKQMLVYQHTFKFREPYQVIVDDELVLECDKSSFDLTKGLARTLQAEVKPMITQCCMQALYETKNQRAIEYAKTFERRRCGHLAPDSKPPHECIKSIVNIKDENKHRYVVASENEKLRYFLRKIPGVPLIHMKRSVMIMEPLSTASSRASQTLEKSKLTGGLNNAKSGIIGANTDADASKAKKRKGPKEPNPLSIKKKRTTTETQQKNETQEHTDKKKRRRRHNKSGESQDEDKEMKDTKESENEKTEKTEKAEENSE